jgi:hypothetical protein
MDTDDKLIELCGREARLVAYLWRHFPEERVLDMDPITVTIGLLDKLREGKPHHD